MTYFKGIENDVQFDCILATDGMVDLTCVGEGGENHYRSDKEQSSENVSFLRGGKGG